MTSFDNKVVMDASGYTIEWDGGPQYVIQPATLTVKPVVPASKSERDGKVGQLTLYQGGTLVGLIMVDLEQVEDLIGALGALKLGRQEEFYTLSQKIGHLERMAVREELLEVLRKLSPGVKYEEQTDGER